MAVTESFTGREVGAGRVVSAHLVRYGGTDDPPHTSRVAVLLDDGLHLVFRVHQGGPCQVVGVYRRPAPG